jgi:hypothetical protein
MQRSKTAAQSVVFVRLPVRSFLYVALGILSSLGFAQNPSPATPAPQRQINGRTIISKELPAADLTIGESFRYVGGQVVNLYGKAEAEQHLFVKGASSGPIESFYWIQFEHFLPSNDSAYDYKPVRTVDIGDLSFIYDVKAFADYEATRSHDDPASDGFAIGRLLTQHGLAFPKTAGRVRMFYLPGADRRSELMIIYGEALPRDYQIPAAADGVPLDESSPELAKTILDHARSGLSIRKH